MGNLPFLGPALVINEDGDLLERCGMLNAMTIAKTAEQCRERIRSDDMKIGEVRLRADEIREALLPLLGDDACATLLEHFGLRNNFTDAQEEDDANDEERTVDATEVFATLVPLATALDMEERCEALFRIRFGPPSPKLNSPAVVSLVARLTKGIHAAFLLDPPPLKLIQQFVRDNAPEDGRWMPRNLARAISKDAYASSYIKCLQTPVDGQQLCRDCRHKYLRFLVRLSNAGSEHEAQGRASAIMDHWSDDESEPEQVREMPLFELSFNEVCKLWQSVEGVDSEILVEAYRTALQRCKDEGVSYSKSIEEHDAFEHANYIYHSISSEDLSLMAVPAIAFAALDPRRSGRLPARLCANLAALCAEISEDYDALPTEEFQAVCDPRYGIQTAKAVSRASAWAISCERIHYEDQLRRRFRTYDKDDSGDVESTEFEEEIQSVISQFIVPQTERQRMMMEDVGQLLADEMMSVIDIDNSGKVDFNEFRLGVRLLHSKFKEMRRAFGNTTSLLEVVDVVLRDLVHADTEKEGGNLFSS